MIAKWKRFKIDEERNFHFQASKQAIKINRVKKNCLAVSPEENHFASI